MHRWKEIDNELTRVFEFEDFKQAFEFMSRVAELAENLNHHPRIENVYNKVTIALSTHDAGNKVTDKDTAMAAAINMLS